MSLFNMTYVKNTDVHKLKKTPKNNMTTNKKLRLKLIVRGTLI